MSGKASPRGKKKGNAAPTPGTPPTKTKKPGGGTATGGGVNFQAAVTAIIAVHVLRGSALDWFSVADVPLAIWAESEGAGDDIRLEFSSGLIAEVQVKKGLERNDAMWDSLEGMAIAIGNAQMACGALAVAPDSSRTIREDLSQDILRLGQGRDDRLNDIGEEFKRRLKKIGLEPATVCEHIRVRVVHALKADGADIKAAKEALSWVCERDDQRDAAWDALYQEAVASIEHRGRWTIPFLLTVLGKAKIGIRDEDFPVSTTAKLSNWLLQTGSHFTLAGSKKQLPLNKLLKLHAVVAEFDPPEAPSPAAALEKYQAPQKPRSFSSETLDAEWIGRFRRRAVVVAGPGIGKSTLVSLLAWRYASDGYPVLQVKLDVIAAAMRNGQSFSSALVAHGVDGSGITPDRFHRASPPDIVVLADGLDECGEMHETVAQALHDFAAGHPHARVVVTTRPIGYSTPALAQWRHYHLLGPETEKGAENLCKLLEALEPSQDWESIARLELGRSRAANAISRSPQLLGMAAVLIARKGSLPNTRPALYAQLLQMLEQTSGEAVRSPHVSPVRRRILEAFGWSYMLNPLRPVDVVVRDCADTLSAELANGRLDALETVGKALHFWEEVGLIERVHHDGTSYWAFMHKTFAEYAAARHLPTMPSEEREHGLLKALDEPAWNEVAIFAAASGSAVEIARILIERRESRQAGDVARALSIACDADVKIEPSQVEEIAHLAFAALESDGKDRFALGPSLVTLSVAYPDVLAAVVAPKLGDERPWLQLIAWACAVSATPKQFGHELLEDIFRRFLPSLTGITIDATLAGRPRVRMDSNRQLVQTIALAALAAQPDVSVERFGDALLEEPVLCNVGFMAKVSDALRTRGVKREPLSGLPPLQARSSLLTQTAFALLAPPSDWKRAAAKAILAVASAFPTRVPSSLSLRPASECPNFAALLAAIAFSEVPVSDVYAWDKPYDAAAVQDILQAVAKSSEIDPHALHDEAQRIADVVNQGGDILDIRLQWPHVDVTEPDWRAASARLADRKSIASALGHGSRWLAYVAVSIFSASKPNEEAVRALLRDAPCESMWAASGAVLSACEPEVAVRILLERINDGSLADGAEHLFSALSTFDLMYSPDVARALSRGLLSPSGLVSEGAAGFAKHLVDLNEFADANLLLQAYDHSRQIHPVESGLLVQHSPRAMLVQVLLDLDALQTERCIDLLGDSRSDVRHIAQERLTSLMSTSEEDREKILSAVARKEFAPEMAITFLRAVPTLTARQITDLEPLLSDSDPRWRLAGMEMLTSEHLASDRLQAHVERLRADEVDEVRKRAARLEGS